MPKQVEKPQKRLLLHLYQVKKKTPEDLAKRFKVSVPTVRKWLKEDGLLVANKLERSLGESGYKSWDHFFSRNTKLSQAQMAEILDCSTVTLGKYHRRWRERGG